MSQQMTDVINQQNYLLGVFLTENGPCSTSSMSPLIFAPRIQLQSCHSPDGSWACLHVYGTSAFIASSGNSPPSSVASCTTVSAVCCSLFRSCLVSTTRLSASSPDLILCPAGGAPQKKFVKAHREVYTTSAQLRKD